MAEIVAEVGEISLLRAGGNGDCQSLVQREVGRVGFVAQGVDDENRNIKELSDHFFGHMMTVAEVANEPTAGAGKNIAVDDHASVRNFGWRYFQISDGKGTIDLVGFGANVVAVGVLPVECVIKHAPQVSYRVGGSVNRHGAIGKFAKSPKVIKAGNVVGVGVGENRCVDLAKAVAQRLGPQIGRSVDQHGSLQGLDKNGRAESLVARIGGLADCTVAGDKGNALGCACSKKGQ